MKVTIFYLFLFFIDYYFVASTHAKFAKDLFTVAGFLTEDGAVDRNFKNVKVIII